MPVTHPTHFSVKRRWDFCKQNFSSYKHSSIGDLPDFKDYGDFIYFTSKI